MPSQRVLQDVLAPAVAHASLSLPLLTGRQLDEPCMKASLVLHSCPVQPALNHETITHARTVAKHRECWYTCTAYPNPKRNPVWRPAGRRSPLPFNASVRPSARVLCRQLPFVLGLVQCLEQSLVPCPIHVHVAVANPQHALRGQSLARLSTSASSFIDRRSNAKLQLNRGPVLTGVLMPSMVATTQLHIVGDSIT